MKFITHYLYTYLGAKTWGVVNIPRSDGEIFTLEEDLKKLEVPMKYV